MRRLVTCMIILMVSGIAFAADYCGVTFTNERDAVKDSVGKAVVRIDQNGNVLLNSTSFTENSDIGTSFFNRILIKFSGTIKAVLSNPETEIFGIVHENDNIGVVSDSFLVKYGSTNVLRIDSGGNLYSKGKAVYNKAQAGCDADGNYCNGNVKENRDYYCKISSVSCIYDIISSTNCGSDGYGPNYCSGGADPDNDIVRDYLNRGCSGGNCYEDVQFTETVDTCDGLFCDTTYGNLRRELYCQSTSPPQCASQVENDCKSCSDSNSNWELASTVSGDNGCSAGSTSCSTYSYADDCYDIDTKRNYYCQNADNYALDTRNCPEAYCNDPDGSDIYTTATVTFRVKECSAGACRQEESSTDSCVSSDTVRERICEGTTLAGADYQCPNWSCSDSDGGGGGQQNRYGEVTQNGPSCSGGSCYRSVSRDTCVDSNTVREYYCSGTTVVSENMDCYDTGTCSAGECVYPA